MRFNICLPLEGVLWSLWHRMILVFGPIQEKERKRDVGSGLFSQLVMLTRVHKLKITLWPRSIPKRKGGGGQADREREIAKKGELWTWFGDDSLRITFAYKYTHAWWIPAHTFDILDLRSFHLECKYTLDWEWLDFDKRNKPSTLMLGPHGDRITQLSKFWFSHRRDDDGGDDDGARVHRVASPTTARCWVESPILVFPTPRVDLDVSLFGFHGKPRV